MSSMKSFQKRAAKAQTDALVDPTAVETEDATKHAAPKSGHAPRHNQAKGHMQSAKGGQKSTGRKKV